MASIRRTLSPVPRPGTLLSGEPCSISSPLSKSSSSLYNLNYSQSPLEYALYRAQDFVLGIFFQRSSRSIERGKVKGHIWRKSLFHFLISFVFGVFIGFTPFIWTNSSFNLVSKHQDLSFKEIPTVEKFQMAPRNIPEIIEKLVVPDNTTFISNGFNESWTESSNNATKLEDSHNNLLIVVTPTYNRPFQAYYLNRLAYTLKLVHSPLLWIVVEMNSQSTETAEILRRTGIVYRQLVCKKNITEVKDSRVHQRNAALSHIETHRLDGIVYFADDSNIYSVELFARMRQIRRFGIWTVAKLFHSRSQHLLEGPVCNGTDIIGWHTNDRRRKFRRFHALLSGFAFNSTILWDPQRWHRQNLDPIRQIDTIKDSFQVISAFIEQVVEDETQMEGLLQDRSKILVWNLDEFGSSYSYPQNWVLKNNLEATTHIP